MVVCGGDVGGSLLGWSPCVARSVPERFPAGMVISGGSATRQRLPSGKVSSAAALSVGGGEGRGAGCCRRVWCAFLRHAAFWQNTASLRLLRTSRPQIGHCFIEPE